MRLRLDVMDANVRCRHNPYVVASWLKLLEVLLDKLELLVLIDAAAVLTAFTLLLSVVAAVRAAAWSATELDSAWLKL